VIRNWIRQIKFAEPPKREVQVDLFTEPSLRTDTPDISYQQHAHHQFRITRRTTRGTVELSLMDTNAGQVDHSIYRPKYMITWDMSLNREIIEQSGLCFLTWSHHRDQTPLLTKELNQQSVLKTT
jgi:hypothetical protein